MILQFFDTSFYVIFKQAGTFVTDEGVDPREHIIKLTNQNDREEQPFHKHVLHPGLNDRCVM